MQLVNGYACRNCADVELAKKGLDPAKPGREWSGGEVYVAPPDPKTDPRAIRLGKVEANDPTDAPRKVLGVNHPEASGTVGTRLSLFA